MDEHTENRLTSLEKDTSYLMQKDKEQNGSLKEMRSDLSDFKEKTFPAFQELMLEKLHQMDKRLLIFGVALGVILGLSARDTYIELLAKIFRQVVNIP